MHVMRERVGATDHFSVLRTETPPTVQLLQRNFASKDTGDRSCVLDTLVDHLLFFAFVSVLFHTKIKNFLSQAVESRKVLVAETETNVPVVWVSLCCVQEDAVVFNQPRPLFRIPNGFDVRFQVVHERVEMSG